MDLALLAGGAFAVAVIVLADRSDDIVDRLVTSDDPLTDFDAELDDEADHEDSPDAFEDA